MRRIPLCLLFLFAVAGCENPVDIANTYTPRTLEQLSGAVSVENFVYARPEGIAENEFQTKGYDEKVFLTEPVGDYVAKAIKREFRQAGIRLRGADACSLAGIVEKFQIVKLGSFANKVFGNAAPTETRFNFNLTFLLIDSGGDRLFKRKEEQTIKSASEDRAGSVAFNKAIANAADNLLTDPAFVVSLREDCAG